MTEENQGRRVVALALVAICNDGTAYAAKGTPDALELANSQPTDETPTLWDYVEQETTPRAALESAGGALRQDAKAAGITLERMFVYDEHASMNEPS